MLLRRITKHITDQNRTTVIARSAATWQSHQSAVMLKITVASGGCLCAPAPSPSGRFAWQNGCPAVWCRGSTSLAMTELFFNFRGIN